jgi:hypothetical protein
VFSCFRGYTLQKHLPSTVSIPGIAAPSYMVWIDSAATSRGGASSAAQTRLAFFAAGNCRGRTVDDSFARERPRHLLPVDAERWRRRCEPVENVAPQPLTFRI